MDTIEAADKSDTIITMTEERFAERRLMALKQKQATLTAKLEQLGKAKFEDPAQKSEAIARCKAGLDELKSAISASSSEGKQT